MMKVNQQLATSSTGEFFNKIRASCPSSRLANVGFRIGRRWRSRAAAALNHDMKKIRLRPLKSYNRF